MFNLENEIKKWRKNLEKQTGLEPGYIEELESHLRDKIDSLQKQGYAKQDAFEKAVSVISDSKEIAEEYQLARTNVEYRPPWKSRYWIPALLPNFLKTSFRNFWRQKTISIINVFGLAVGFACCLFIFMYIWDELHFDAFHKKSDRIFRVVETNITESGEFKSAYVPNALGSTVVNEIAEVEKAVRVFPGWRLTVGPVEAAQIVRNYHIVDPEFFDLFDYPLLSGTPEDALTDPGSVVLTFQMAKKLFGDRNPIGETIRIEAEDFPEFGESGFTVTGVLKTLPRNTHLDFKLLISKSTVTRFPEWNDYFESWQGSFGTAYLLLKDKHFEERVEEKINPLLLKYIDSETADQSKLMLQPLENIHFYSADISGEFNHNEGQLSYIYLFGFIAFLILIIASINYMNLATARSVFRAKEIGLRKVSGADKLQIIVQFLGESGLTTFFAMVMAFAITWVSLPYFNFLTGKAVTFELFTSGIFLYGSLLLTVLITLIAGFYPAVYLSGFQPANILKGKISGDNSSLRKGLVIVQFTLSIVMITAALIAQKQLNFIQHKNLGFEEKHKIVVDINHDDLQSNYLTVREEMLRHPAVENVTASSRVPGDTKSFRQASVYRDGRSPENTTTVFFNGVDEYFLETYEIGLHQGRNFNRALASDTAAILINETASNRLFRDNPIGKALHFPDFNFSGKVVGIIDDFNFQSLHNEMQPMVLGFMPRGGRHPVHGIDYFTISVNNASVQAAIDHIKTVHNKFDPINPVEYSFLDNRLQNLYDQDRKVSRLFGIASALAVIIASIGLFGLSAFFAERRTKEIGIRKVLGAKTGSILLLLTSDFMKLVAISFLMAIPVSWYLSGQWLENFAYRADMGVGVFLSAGIIALSVALFTVVWQSLKASLMNPVNSLRSE